MAVLSKIIETEEDDITVLALNITSLHTNKYKLERLLHNTNIDVICLQETKLTKTKLKNFKI